MASRVADAARLAREAEWLRERSLSLGIPSIEPSDGIALYTLAFTAALLHGEGVLVDAGAGIGYSTLWIAAGVRQAGCTRCRVYAVEAESRLAREAERVLSSLESVRGVDVRVVNMDALEFLEGLREGEAIMVFLDIEKEEYPTAIRAAYEKLRTPGVLAVHNAFYPPPPPEAFEALDELGFSWSVAPTPPGLVVAWKGGKRG